VLNPWFWLSFGVVFLVFWTVGHQLLSYCSEPILKHARLRVVARRPSLSIEGAPSDLLSAKRCA